MPNEPLLQFLFAALPALHEFHAPNSDVYVLLKAMARREMEGRFSSPEVVGQDFGPFGNLTFPFYAMGAVSSLNLFDLDELIMFSFYWKNRHRYHRVADVGANIGLHSVVLSRCGLEVRAYEPDPQHFAILERNMKLNSCSATAFQCAVSATDGEMEFTRVLGNTTGSHLTGAKPNPYGPLERFQVKVVAFHDIVRWADLVKMDVEGHEKDVLLSTDWEDWIKTDALVEVGSETNARAIYDHFMAMGVKLFSQKRNWHQVEKEADMPFSYKEGTLFITCKNEVPWS